MDNRKKILINASTVKISGGLYIALDLISYLVSSPDIKTKIICPSIRPFQRFREKTEVQHVPEIFFHYILRPFLDYWWLKKQINAYNADLVVSLSNLPARTGKKQIFFHDHAFMSIPDFRNLNLSLKSRFIHHARRFVFRQRIRFIDHLVVQSELEKERLIQLYGSGLPILIFPPLLPSHLKNNISIIKFNGISKNRILIGCLSRYFEHKNIEILSEAALMCKKQNLPYQFIITVDPSMGKRARHLLSRISELKLSDFMINAGKIKRKNISAFMRSIDALILPSLIESYSLNYIESWFHRKPLFVADKDFSRKICKSDALYFQLSDPASIIHALQKYFNHTEHYTQMLNEGEKRVMRLPKPHELIKTLLILSES
jgi:glycosyltransferase involved in cell wall biosynthesis